MTQTKREKAAAYRRVKKKAREHSQAIIFAGQDIGELPAIVDLSRRARADNDFKFFCETYFPKVFYLPWSADHLRVIAKIERVIVHRETLAVAMPRGSGKTSLCLAAVEWGLLTGRHRFVYLIAGTESIALRLLGDVKMHLSTSDELLADYPEAIYPIHALEGESRRCGGQRYCGVPTMIEWAKSEIVFPTIPGSRASGAVVRVSGLDAHIRGAVYACPDGAKIRPTLAICDDPQTDATARSLIQTKERLDILRGAVWGLAGPDDRTGIIVPCTVIEPGDLADQLLDRKENPVFQGERTKLLYAFPTNEGLWARYGQTRADEFRAGGDGRKSTEFYVEHRTEMDLGAEPAWSARFTGQAGEVSAVQHAMNLLADRGRTAFFAEFQNEPVPERTAELLRPEHVMEKLSGRPRGDVPLAATRLTAFIDVHDKLLFWAVCGWDDAFSGWLVDYGTYPRQAVPYFSMDGVRFTLAREFAGAGTDGAIQSGLARLVATLLDRTFTRGSGLAKIDRLLVDAGYKPHIVDAVKHSHGGATMVAYRGLGIRAGRRPMSSWVRHKGETHGHNWYMPSVRKTREFPYVAGDVNYWKTALHRALACPAGDAGAFVLFGKDPHEHELLAAHLTLSESWVETQGQGRTVHEWNQRPAKPDNHWFDCLVGCAVAASMLGAKLPGQDEVVRVRGKPRRQWTAGDLQGSSRR